MDESRHAIYFVPEDDTAVARFGHWWLRQPAAGTGPRHYGFHATLKPPFRLAAGCAAGELAAALEAFARLRPAFIAPPLRIGALDGFLALRPAAPSQSLDTLAEDCLREFDRFRAPPCAAELARRQRAGLSPRQQELLDRWGYPYVLDQYRFHMTLTDRLDAPTRAETHELLARLAAGFEGEPLAVGSVCLFVQPAPSQSFALAHRFALAG